MINRPFVKPAVVLAAAVSGAVPNYAQSIDLPTSKQIIRSAPGNPQQMNSLPISMAVSPDGKYVVTLNAGFGTFESGYMQSLAVMNTATGALADFPDDRTLVRAKQTLYSGLAFSRDGKHIYASMGSETDPVADGSKAIGSGVAVYSFIGGKITSERLIPLPPQQLAQGRTTLLLGDKEGDKGLPFPAAIAVLGQAGAEKLLVAGNLSDDVLLLDSVTGKVEKRFDLSESDVVPATYPVALAVAHDESRAFVGLWNASEIVELDLKRGSVGRKIQLLKPRSATAPGTHPAALAIAPDEKIMYVALANRDAVAAVNIAGHQFRLRGFFDTRLPGQSYFGAEPQALAISSDGTLVYVANGGSNAIAVLDPKRLTSKLAKTGMAEPIGFLPTEWMPTALAYVPHGPEGNGKLYVATGKGKGTGPNNFPQRSTESTESSRLARQSFTYIGTLIHGSLAVLDPVALQADLPGWTAEVLESNRMHAAEEKIRFADGTSSPIKHVIYIIKENRTYDQVFGDLNQNGRAVGNGDKALAMYGADITPNQHKLALQFGVLDNFYDSGEVSGDGHVWSTAAIGTDYLEKVWEQNYRGGQRSYDFEGVVSEGLPLQQNIPDIDEPMSGYLWGNLARHGKTYFHFGEFISSTFCDAKKSGSSEEGPLLEGVACKQSSIKQGEAIPAEWGGGVSKWPWPIPLIAKNTPTKPELRGHFAPEQADFNLRVPEQIRAEVFLRHLSGWLADRKAGKDTMPNFILLRYGNDHTAGTTAGGPTPKSSVADNDLAVGRSVEAISHSPFWDNTAFFILEDDAQNGADHVDAHRSLALVVSKYSPNTANGTAFVDSRFYSTVSIIRTMETLLGLPPMNNNDAFSSMISSLFTGAGNQPAFDADYSNRENGLIYTANQKNAPGAKESAKMNFRHADQADAQKLNVILWKDAMGNKPLPALLLEHRKKNKKADDD